MALRMVKLVRDPKSGSWKSRKVIPTDVRASYGKANETPTWPATLTAAEAKVAWSEWLSDVESRIERHRARAAARPVRLSNRDIHALAGRWYSERVRAFEDDPGAPVGWQVALDEIVYEDEAAADAARRAKEPYDGAFKRVGWLDTQLNELLVEEGLVLDPDTLVALRDRVYRLHLDLCRLMLKRAEGDYSPDPVAPQLPTWQGPVPVSPQRAASVPIMELFDRYAAERMPAAATRKAWTRQLRHFIAFLGQDDATVVQPTDVVRWKDHLLGEPTRAGSQRSAKTVRDTYLAAVKTVLAYGVENQLLAANAAATVTARGPKKVRHRDPGLRDAEAKLILQATKSPPAGLTRERELAFRWVPWLCAYSGARVNELTQLRREDVYEDDGVWVIRITPEAGSVKNSEARIVPLHSHLIDMGFPAVASNAPSGPLFFDPRRHRGGKSGNPQSKKVGEALASWVRELGVDDENVAPNHGWRHRFKTIMRSADVDVEARNMLLGHAPASDGEGYGQWTARTLQREIEKTPRIDLEDR